VDEFGELLDRIDQHPALEVNWSVRRLEWQVAEAMVDKLLQAVEILALNVP
jgi:hypothetical protein